MNLETTDKGHHLFKFESVTEMIGFVDGKHYKEMEAGFVGARLGSWEDAMKKAENVWAEGRFTLDQFIEKLKKLSLPEIGSFVRQTNFDSDDGDEIDMDRLNNGEPFWRKTEREQKSGCMEVTVFSDVSANAGTSPLDLLWRGAAAIALTSVLEDKGYSVDLWVVEGTTVGWNKKNIINACRVKAPGVPMVFDTIVNSMAGWFYRTVDFTLYRTQLAHLNIVSEGYGGAYTPIPAELDMISPDPNRIYSSGVFSFDHAATLMEREIGNLDIKGTK
jgi:hypothetical protein